MIHGNCANYLNSAKNNILNTIANFGNIDDAFAMENNIFSNVFRTDILDYNDKYVLKCELPGLKKSDIDIDIDGSVLSITINTADNVEITPPDEDASEAVESEPEFRYILKETTCKNCVRKFKVPNIKPGEIKADYDNGLLTVTIPKAEPTKTTRKITVE